MTAMTFRSLTMLTFSILVVSCNGKKEQQTEETNEEAVVEQDSFLPLNRLNLPEGFKIEIFAKGLDGARSMAMGDDGTLFVGTRREGNVYAVKDTDGDYKADKMWTIASGMTLPNGVAFKDGSLYLADVSRLLKYKNIENELDNPSEPELIYDDYPEALHHGWKYIAFGPDDKLYVPVGAPCKVSRHLFPTWY